LKRSIPGLTLSALLLAAAGAHARPESSIVPGNTMPGPLKAVRYDQHLGEQVPLDLAFRDDAGRPVRLGDYLGKRPAVLVLAYYRCPMLCDMVMQAAESGLKPLSLDPGKDFEVIVASIDPTDTPERAAMKKRDIVQRYARPGTEGGWHFLSGGQPPLSRLASSSSSFSCGVGRPPGPGPWEPPDMKSTFPLFPDSASALSGHVDALYIIWAVVSVFFTLLIAGLIVFFMTRYRRRDPEQVGVEERAIVWLELLWSAVPLVIMLAMFAWGTRVFFQLYRPPVDAVEYTAIGKQWMWKIQHPEGQREINALHIPVGQAIKVKLASEDVIHSFYIPAFRIKQDAVPGRYTSLWFKATKPGTYHLFCAEYCGTEHSRMIGSVIVMETRDYENWLAGGTAGKSMVASGAELFTSHACDTCHRASPGIIQRGPKLEGVYNSQVKLADGRTVVADDNYIRESILNPTAKVVAGYDPVMPTFQGQVTEEQLTQLIAYVRSLGAGSDAALTAGATATTAAATPAAPTAQPNAGSKPQK
jgi:cytochrome c oxidase subunit 2